MDEHTFGTDAFAAIQDGIDAVAGSTVHVAAGIYYENIIMKDGVEVLGAGADVTTIDGSGSGSVVTADNVGSGTKLDGFTITNGLSEHYGGGIYLSRSSPTVTNCTFVDNSAPNNGGGMYNFDSSPTVTNCTFLGNSATIVGGGMHNTYNNSSPTVTDCTFSGNSAAWGGGMYNADYSSPTVTNCTFVDNSAPNTAGGMYNFDSSPTVTNCTFSGNSANEGGGMYNYYNSSPAISNNIIVNNTASTGGGIWADGTSLPTIGYNDVWNNTGGDYYGCSAGLNDISEDPLFVDPAVDDYHLQPGSPCIDLGDNTAVPPELTTDFEGDPRIVDGDGDTIAVVDMGADEYLPPGPGLLRVETSPPVPTRIFLEGIPRNDWGLDWVKMPAGEYTLSFTDVSGYLAPISQPIEILPDTVTEVIASFVQLGNLRVETSPALPATIFANGNPMNDWGFWVTLEEGEYTVSFQDMPGYVTPSEVVVTVNPGETTHVIGDYVPE